MKNLFAYDFTTNTIVASKATLKKAGNPTTPEYKALMKMIAEQPTFKVVPLATVEVQAACNADVTMGNPAGTHNDKLRFVH